MFELVELDIVVGNHLLHDVGAVKPVTVYLPRLLVFAVNESKDLNVPGDSIELSL